MNDLKRQLREADPVAREAGLAPDDVDRMRRVVLAATRPAPAHVAAWSWLLVAAMAVIAGAGTAVTVSQRGPVTPVRIQETREDLTTRAPVRRQLQFVTPGGTRVIWTFDSNFEMR